MICQTRTSNWTVARTQPRRVIRITRDHCLPGTVQNAALGVTTKHGPKINDQVRCSGNPHSPGFEPVFSCLNHTFLKSSHMSSVSSLSSHVILVSSHGMTCHPHVIRAGMTCHPSPQHEGDNLSSPTGAHSSILSLVCPILAAAGC
mgnify:CR=1 FL=1